MGYGLSVVSSAYQHTVTSAAQTYESYNTSNNTQQHWVLMWAVQASEASVVRLNRTQDCITPFSFTPPHLINTGPLGVKCE